MGALPSAALHPESGMRARIPPEMSNYYCHPGKAGGSPLGFGTTTMLSILRIVSLLNLVMKKEAFQRSSERGVGSCLGKSARTPAAPFRPRQSACRSQRKRSVGLCCKTRRPPSSWVQCEGRERAMSDFKGRHFEGEVVLWRSGGIAATG